MCLGGRRGTEWRLQFQLSIPTLNLFPKFVFPCKLTSPQAWRVSYLHLSHPNIFVSSCRLSVTQPVRKKAFFSFSKRIQPTIRQLLESGVALSKAASAAAADALVNRARARPCHVRRICIKVTARPWGSISSTGKECGWGLAPRAAVWVALCNELQLLPPDLMPLWKYITWTPPGSHPFSFVHLRTGH